MTDCPNYAIDTHIYQAWSWEGEVTLIIECSCFVRTNLSTIRTTFPETFIFFLNCWRNCFKKIRNSVTLTSTFILSFLFSALTYVKRILGLPHATLMLYFWLHFLLYYLTGDAGYFQYRSCMDGDNLRVLEAAGVPIVSTTLRCMCTCTCYLHATLLFVSYLAHVILHVVVLCHVTPHHMLSYHLILYYVTPICITSHYI